MFFPLVGKRLKHGIGWQWLLWLEIVDIGGKFAGRSL
jgi:hypothetical protein